jgi:formylmethanofuran dehydrogenase subunit C
LEHAYDMAWSRIPRETFYLSHVQDLIYRVDQDPELFPDCIGGVAISALVNSVIESTDVLYVDPVLVKPGFEALARGFYSGAFLERGTVVFRSDSFSSLGYGMKGGRVVVEGKHNPLHRDFNGVASKMRGGEIIVKQGVRGKCDIGREMSGGKIELHGDARGDVGSHMDGGSIHIQGNMYRLGVGLRRATIVVGGDCFESDLPGPSFVDGTIIIRGAHHGAVGQRQQGGAVMIERHSGGNVGWEMRGGSIEIKRSDVSPHIGFGMRDGDITYTGRCRDVGSGMSGGRVLVCGSVHQEAGGHMTGGTLTIDGDVGGPVGTCMSGGRIGIHGEIQGYFYKVNGGEVYQNGRRLPVRNPIARLLFNMFKK